MKLSGFAAKRIDWARIEESAAGGSRRAGADISFAPPSPVDLAPVFATARAEFQRALASLHSVVVMLLWGAGASIVVSLVGVLIAAAWQQIIGGAIFTAAGAGALLTLFLKIREIGRDQALLELIPTKYELALEMATSDADRKKILDSFLAETESLRGKT